MRPPGSWVFPTCINPFKKVPAVNTIHLAWNVTSQNVFNPTTSPFSTMISFTVSCQIWRFGIFSNISRQAQINLFRSHWARGLHMAGPFERFSMRNWIAVWSVTNPIYPPKASISRTICPLAIPPTAGLQLICATLFISIVIKQVFEPKFAAAAAASQPACPAPITITSYLKSIESMFIS